MKIASVFTACDLTVADNILLSLCGLTFLIVALILNFVTLVNLPWKLSLQEAYQKQLEIIQKLPSMLSQLVIYTLYKVEVLRGHTKQV